MSLISPEYKALQEQFHKDRPDYGTHGKTQAKIVSKIIDQMEINNVLDYGAGKCLLGKNLSCKRRVKIWCYDPCIEELSDPPTPTEMVVCTDVLEHIEPTCLDDVLKHIKEMTVSIGYFTIHTGPAAKTLPDGRNAHLIQEDYRWWMPKIWDLFEVGQMSVLPHHITMLVYPRGNNGT